MLFKDLISLIAYGNGATNEASNQVGSKAKYVVEEYLYDRVLDMLNIISDWIIRAILFDKLELSNQSINRKRFLDPLIDVGWISMEHPQTPTHPKQRYRITEAGKTIKLLIEG